MKQILYRIKSLFLLVAIAGGISACADDKGNYNYHDIPEVKIEGIGNSITALAYQNLSIPVQLDGLQADDMNTSGWQSGSSKRKTQMTPQAKCWQPQKNLMTLYLYAPVLTN